jgi:predicted nuclease of predicted toxin-antitoxin system
MTSFVVDQQLPTALARWLSVNGMNAVHIKDLGRTGASDAWIWRYALESGRCIITKDNDFGRRWRSARVAPRIVWFRCPNAPRGTTVALFARHWPSIVAALEQGEDFVEVVAAI